MISLFIRIFLTYSWATGKISSSAGAGWFLLLLARRENRELREASDLEAEVLFPEDVDGLVALDSKNLDPLEDTFSESSSSLNIKHANCYCNLTFGLA